MKSFVLAAVSAAALLTACGGGGNSGETKAQITSVKVVGASLADSGTFGYKFTVQSSTGSPYRVYSERVAATYGITSLCPAYTANLAGRNTGCTNFAVASASVNHVQSGASVDTVPLSLVKQLVDVGNAGFGANDLLLVGEGSANDAADLATAYLTSLQLGQTGSPTGAYRTLLATLITNPTTLAALSDVQAGGLYMQLLADKLTAAIKTNALDKGAQRIVVLNTLDVTKTPKFNATMALLTANFGAPTAASIQALLQGWIQAYNTRLDTDLSPYASKVAVVDFYTNFNAEMADPAQYGLTDVTATVCDQVYATTSSTPYAPSVATAGSTALSTAAVVAACKDGTASAITPTQSATGTSTWWQTYLYADNFHPTPYGHQLLAQLVAKRLTEAGWL